MKNLRIILVLFLIFLLFLFLVFRNKEIAKYVKPTLKRLNPSNSLIKNDEILNNFVESTPFVWKGRLRYLVSERTIQGEDHRLGIYDFDTKERIASFGEGLGLGSAIVHENVLYVFATKNWGKKGESEIYLMKSSDLQNFSEPEVVYKANPKQAVFNTSVTRNTDTGKFIMAMEVDEDNFVAFTIRLLESDNLMRWKQVPNAIFGKDVYVACPAIRYINKAYYMWFLAEEYNDPNCKTCLTYVEKIARSKDLVKWEISPHYFLAPDRKDEGINTSDIDLVEYNKKTYIFYAAGDQATWSNLRYMIYNNSLSSLVKIFFENTNSHSNE